MNGFNNWRGLKRPFHNYCLPLLDYSSAAGVAEQWGSQRTMRSGTCAICKAVLVQWGRSGECINPDTHTHTHLHGDILNINVYMILMPWPIIAPSHFPPVWCVTARELVVDIIKAKHLIAEVSGVRCVFLWAENSWRPTMKRSTVWLRRHPAEWLGSWLYLHVDYVLSCLICLTATRETETEMEMLQNMPDTWHHVIRASSLCIQIHKCASD